VEDLEVIIDRKAQNNAPSVFNGREQPPVAEAFIVDRIGKGIDGSLGWTGEAISKDQEVLILRSFVDGGFTWPWRINVKGESWQFARQHSLPLKAIYFRCPLH